MRSAGSSARSCSAACGETSRPSVKAWSQVRSGANWRSALTWSMCECTPPCETSPSRWTCPPRAKAAFKAGFSKNAPSAIARLTRCRSWSSTRPEPIVRWPTSELPIWPGGTPTASPEALIVVCGNSAQRRSKTGVSASSIAFPGPGGAQPQPSRMTRTTRGVACDADFRGRVLCPCARLERPVEPLAFNSKPLDGRGDPAKLGERFHVERGSADESPVDALLREQLLRVLGLDRAAVEHRHAEQLLDEAVRLPSLARAGGLVGADRPDRLVGDHEALALADGVPDRLDLDAEHELHLSRLALLERLADASDHAQAVLQGGERAARHRLVGLTEVLAPLGVADNRARDAELEQHRRRHLPGEGAVCGPVHVLGEDRVPALDRGGQRDERRTEHRFDAVGRRERRAELTRLARVLEHLPVAGDQLHAPGITATPGSSLPSSSSSAAPPPVEAHETRSSRPSSLSARIESAPPTTENASAPATASATAFVPSAKGGHSKTPIGPFQKIVFAELTAAAKRSRVSGPTSSPSQPSGSSSYGTTFVSASSANSEAATTSTGSSTSKPSGERSRSSSAILPPTRTVSALPPRLRRTPSLSSTLAPPEISTNGRSTSPSSFPRCSSSCSSSRPA